MYMKIILIYGEQDAGKSTTCSKILKLLLALSAKIKSYDTFEWGDFKALVEFEDKLIGIYSPGDESAHLSEAINFGVSKECDFLIATVRKGIQYNAPLATIHADDSQEWQYLDKGSNETEKDRLENKLAILTIEKILQK